MINGPAMVGKVGSILTRDTQATHQLKGTKIMSKWSQLTNAEAQQFGHLVHNLMNGREWGADTLETIAGYADHLGKPFRDPLEPAAEMIMSDADRIIRSAILAAASADDQLRAEQLQAAWDDLGALAVAAQDGGSHVHHMVGRHDFTVGELYDDMAALIVRAPHLSTAHHLDHTHELATYGEDGECWDEPGNPFTD